MAGLLKAVASSRVWRSIFRHPYPNSDRLRAEAVVQNLVLHLHPVHVRADSLRFTRTLGLGIISLHLFIILAVTGVLLMFYYIPSTTLAYRSMKDLEFAVSFGLLLRNLHRWAAHGMVITVIAHMCRVFYTGAYKPPREFNWIMGVFLLLGTLALSFTGYLLPWDQLAFWAITVGTSIASYAPGLGSGIRLILLGGHEIGQQALIRFYSLHVVIIPALAGFLIALHFWRIRKDGGLARPEEEGQESREGEPVQAGGERPFGVMAIVEGNPLTRERVPERTVTTWPYLLFREFLLFLIVLAVLLVLSLLFNAPLEEPANPAHPPNPAKAPWYFLGLQELVSFSAFVGGVLIPTLLVLCLLILPYVDGSPAGVGRWFARERLSVNIVFTVVLAIGIILTVIGTFFRGPNCSWVWPWLQ